MFAVYATHAAPNDPLSALRSGPTADEPKMRDYFQQDLAAPGTRGYCQLLSIVVMLFRLDVFGFLEIGDGCRTIQLQALGAPNYASDGQEIKLDARTARRTIRRMHGDDSSGKLR